MLVDVFSSSPQRRWLLLALGVPPLILVLRGLANDPTLLDITQMMPPDVTLLRRFGYPSDHPNIIGYLFSMAIPLVWRSQWARRRTACARCYPVWPD
jgi:hypothetical protein